METIDCKSKALDAGNKSTSVNELKGCDGMFFSREEKIAHINKSPESIANHDKDAWLSIFSQDAIVEDPVGSKPHHNGEQLNDNKSPDESALSRFYDTFIAPNNIEFDIKNDIVCQNHVVRDLTININMGRISVSVPTHLLYELTEESGKLKISRLAAHWELVPMIKVLVSEGVNAFPVMGSLSKRMMKYQGLSGGMGFIAGVNRFGGKRKEQVQRFFAAFNQQNNQQIPTLFSSNARVKAPYGTSEITPIELLTNRPGEISFSKLLAAGNTVTASISYLPSEGKTPKQGVALFEFEPSSKAISHLTIYDE